MDFRFIASSTMFSFAAVTRSKDLKSDHIFHHDFLIGKYLVILRVRRAIAHWPLCIVYFNCAMHLNLN